MAGIGQDGTCTRSAIDGGGRLNRPGMRITVDAAMRARDVSRSREGDEEPAPSAGPAPAPAPAVANTTIAANAANAAKGFKPPKGERRRLGKRAARQARDNGPRQET